MGAEMVAFLESVLSGLDCLDCLAGKRGSVTPLRPSQHMERVLRDGRRDGGFS